MALGGGMSCVKYLMFCFNLLFAVSGLIILAVGSWIYHNMNHFVEWMDIGFISSPIILIVVGIVIFVVAFFGCCGAAKENHCMIMTFSVLLLAIFTVEVGVGIAGYVTHGELEGILSKRLNESVNDYHTHTQVQKAFDMLQTELQCCGTNGPQDWIDHPPIPETCCASGLAIVDGVKETCTSQSTNLHHDGCLPALLKFLQAKALVLGGVGLGIAIVQFLGVIFACCLAKSIRREYETV